MARSNAIAVRSTTTGTVASTTGVTALDSTTKVAFAGWVRIPQGLNNSGDILYHGNNGTAGDAVIFRTTSTDAMQVRTMNGTTTTQLSAPRALGTSKLWLTGKWVHVLVAVDSGAGTANWVFNGVFIGKSTTAAVAWTIAGTRKTGIGTYTSTSTNWDAYDVRIWAQNDADIVLAAPEAMAQLAMKGRSAGESARYMAYGPSGRDASGNSRNLTWSPASLTAEATEGPGLLIPELAAARRRRRSVIIGVTPPAANSAALYAMLGLL